ncbi:MAG TPA: hypothetical protein VHM19_19670, partial [Polyangiales bacterium]|nr:hypothetical protein [Polyangiales bacterium]
CPQRGFPPPVAHVTPGPHEYPDQLILKLIEGSHVRMVDGRLTIDPTQMLDEDPSLLACAGLDVPNAQCALVAIVSVLDANPRVSVERSFTRTPEDLDAERAQVGGLTLDKDHYLNDLNLYYVIHVPAEDAPGLYDAIYSNPLVDVLYFPGMPVLPGE